LGLATFDSPTFVGLTLTGLQQFSGTTTVGLRLKSLTTAEYNALTAVNGDLFVDSTTDRIDARLVRGTVELIDSAGGQTIGGTLTVGGQITAPLGSAATPGIVFSGSNSGIYGLSGPLGLMLTSNGGASMLIRGDNAQVVLPSSWGYGWSSTTNPASSQDTRISRNAAGVLQVGTTANNALGSLLLTNLTASGTVRVGTFTVGTLPSASANTRALAFVTDSNLAFNSTNLGATVTAGGSTLVPVFSNGTNWVIG
jgi:hypothetical protein